MNAHSPKLSICEVIRKIYHDTDNLVLKERFWDDNSEV